MKSLREVLADAAERHVAVGHFNISDLGALKAIVAAGRGMNLPILIGVSEGEREFVGVRRAAALIKSIRDEYDYPIFLNADHTHSFDKVKEAAEAGFDEIIFDNSSLPMDENIANTKAAVAAIRAIDPEIVIEGEIGYIGSNSEVMDKAPEGIALSTPEEAVRFVTETGIDVLAPAVGNMHGLLKSMTTGGADAARKHLDIERIAAIKAAIAAIHADARGGGAWMTLHGGSGTEDADFAAAVKSGMTIIHVSSELRLAWRRGVEEALAKDPEEIAPYKLVAPAVAAIQKIVEDRLRLFNGLA